MASKMFERDAAIMASITEGVLRAAAEEESAGQPISSHVVKTLRKHVQASASRVMGSDQSRVRLRSKIWSTSIFLNPPSLWITINPCDLHDPIAQVFAVKEIELDAFLAAAGPSKHVRAQNISDDPYAAAKFFHFIIRVVLRTLFGIEVSVSRHQVISRMGVLGEVAAYFGTVESQKRGTLHLHLLMWLKHAPSLEEMHELLGSEEFRERIRQYIRANIRACADDLETEEDVIMTETRLKSCTIGRQIQTTYNLKRRRRTSFVKSCAQNKFILASFKGVW